MEREAFDLGEIHGRWHGRLLTELRAPLERGLAAASARLAGADFAIVALVSDFNADGLMERIEALEGAANREAAERAARAAHDSAVAGLLDARPGWRIDPEPASRHWHWAAASAYASSRLVGSHVDSAYVRVWTYERAGAPNALDELLADWPREMESEIVSWLVAEGGARRL